MPPTATAQAARRLASRLDRAVGWSRFRLLLQLSGGCVGIAAVAVAGSAGLDCWLRPERFWLGGSVVWLSVAVVAWGQARRCGLPAAWPSRWNVARQWERRWPAAGTSISAAVGFLADYGKSLPPQDAATGTPRRFRVLPKRADVRPHPRASGTEDLFHGQRDSPHGPGRPLIESSAAGGGGGDPRTTSADFAALAIEQADRVADELPTAARVPAVGPGPLLASLMLASGLLASALLGSEDWRQGLLRQLPPAVGGWPLPPGPMAAVSALPPRLTPPEIAAATRRLIERLVDCERVQAAPAFTAALAGISHDAKQLAERLPPAAEAGIIRRAADRLATLTNGPHPAAVVGQLAAAGRAALRLAATAALERTLADQLARIFPRQPGLRADDLTPSAERQLRTLAAAQHELTATAAAAVATLRESGLALPAADRRSGPLAELIRRNRLGRATAAASAAARQLAEQVTRLGLDVPAAAAAVRRSGGDELPRVIVAIAAITNELDREAGLVAAATAGPRVVGALRPGPPVEADGVQAAAGSLGPAGPAGGTQATGAGGTTAAAPPLTVPGDLPAGLGWRLVPPDRSGQDRVAFDQTLLPETAAAFNDYLERLLPPAPDSSTVPAPP